MKKILLLATLLGGVSFASEASNIPNKKQKTFISRKATQDYSRSNVDKFQVSKPNDCGWVSYEIDCGGVYPYLGHTYSCSYGDTLFAKMTTWEQYCGD